MALERDILLLLNDEEPDGVYPRAPLTPKQKAVADELLIGLSVGDVCLLQGDEGMGKTTILGHIHEVSGGAFLSVARFLAVLRDRSPAAIEEAFLELIERHLGAEHLVIVDDLHMITNVVEGYNYPRAHLFDGVLTAILAGAEIQGKKLLFATAGEHVPAPIRRRAYSWQLEEFEAEDYRAICRFHLSESADQLDYEKVYRFAPALNGYQLKNACIWLRRDGEVKTDGFVYYLTTHNMSSNVDVHEVKTVDWKDLKGVDDVIKELEAKIALPFENHALANELQLKPKRGVLLAGPPGTGKTTIGRALAHRLRSKFFLIDGTVIAGTCDFYEKVERIFEAAKKNAPSIIFIDDADIIFEDKEHGFYRYLLTMMDGLESASAERVCVMMTAMEVSNLPPAMLRSGRIELWLHTRLPEEDARLDILRESVTSLPSPLSDVDLKQLAKASRGLTGADLKGVVEDAKLLFAHDQVTQKLSPGTEDYFLRAIAKVRENRNDYRSRRKSYMNAPIGFNME